MSKNHKIKVFTPGNKIVAKEIKVANSDFEQAKISFKNSKNYKWSTIQCYYSMFHAARALLYIKKYREKSHYPRSPKMNTFVERVNGTIQSEYLDRFYDETRIGRINEILYNCLIEYNFYHPHRSLNLLTPIEYCNKLINNKNPVMLQMYWTQTKILLPHLKMYLKAIRCLK